MWVTLPMPEQIENPEKCRGCSAPIIWVQTKTGARMPINTDFEVKGTLFVGVEMIEIEPRFSHFATCPKAQEFHRKKAA